MLHTPEYALHPSNQALIRAEAEERAQTLEALRALQQQNLLGQGSPEALLLAAQSIVYGFARLWLDGQLAGWKLPKAKVDQVLLEVLEVLGRGLLPQRSVSDTRRSRKARSAPLRVSRRARRK